LKLKCVKVPVSDRLKGGENGKGRGCGFCLTVISKEFIMEKLCKTTFSWRVGQWLMGSLAFGLCLCIATMGSAEKLPVYRLAKAKSDPEGVSKKRERAAEILKSVQKGRVRGRVEKADRLGAIVQRAGETEVEIHEKSGGFFVRNAEKLWKPTDKPTRLPSQANARKTADKFLADNALLPTGRAKAKFTDFTDLNAVSDEPRAKPIVLDRQVNYEVEVTVNRGGRDVSLPVVGGGGRFRVAVGDREEVIGAHGVWRPIEEVIAEEEIISKSQAEREFRGKFRNVRVTKADAFLAYYSAPAYEEQEVLAPVWVVKGEIQVGDDRVPMRNVMIAATKKHPLKQPKVTKGRARKKDEQPREGSINEDEVPEVEGRNPRGATHECGAWFIGESGGLSGSAANAKGFNDRLEAAGWKVNAYWGDANCYESDWRSNDDSWVDAADAVFYTGHASPNSWMLSSPDDTSLHYGEVQSAGNDLWGNVDCEWIVIAACGPLQSSHFTTGVGNAFDRWRGSFDGLHILLGYGAVTYDNTSEGSRFAQLCLAGWPVIDAWFRTAWEIQPSTNGYSPPNGPKIYVCAMYAHKGDHATRYDHFWGCGTTVSDPREPGQHRYLMWQGT
jgi:hypothetical protein